MQFKTLRIQDFFDQTFIASKFYLYFSITVCIPYCFVLVSGVCLLVRQSCTLQSCPPVCPVTAWCRPVLSTTFPVLYFPHPGLFCNYQSVLLNPFTFSTQPIKPVPSGNHQSILYLCDFVSILFVHVFCSLYSTYR